MECQPKKSSPPKSLSLDLGSSSRALREKQPGPSKDRGDQSEESPPNVADDPDGEQIRDEIKNYPQFEVVMRRKEPKNITNRLVTLRVILAAYIAVPSEIMDFSYILEWIAIADFDFQCS